MAVNILGPGPVKFFTEAYYLTVRTTDSAFFFDLLYSAMNDPFKTEKSDYEKEKISKVIDIIGKSGFENALDVGCGTGSFTSSLLRVAKKVTGIDISVKAVREAGKKFENEKRLEFKRADVCSFSTDAKFDLFFCSEVLYYLSPEELNKTCLKIKELSLKNSCIVFVGRADDDYVNIRLRDFFKPVIKETIQASFPLYFLPRVRISRPYGVFVYHNKITENEKS
ncbi:class I SAM-dependent methyltransferase [candidate division WOR-3 bacterium]|nr:class I SAM-dependent methyltransferase [candidate division WOR-3 bacterium]